MDIKIKDEPSVQPAVIPQIKEEPKFDEDSAENIELLANLNLESCTSNMSQIKTEFNNTTTDVNTTTMDDSDLKFHLAQQDSSTKFLFYWFDAYEDQYNQQGTVFLFGKTPIIKQKSESDSKASADQLSFASVCCVVKNIQKVIYVLPRKYRVNSRDSSETKELVTMEKVNQEVSRLMQAHKISNFKTKVVKKFYAFDKILSNGESIPYENEYLQVEYSTDQNVKSLSADLEGKLISNSMIIFIASNYLKCTS